MAANIMLPGIGGALNVHGNVQIKVVKFRIIRILNFISVIWVTGILFNFRNIFSYFSWGHIHSDKIKNIRFGK